MKRRLLTILPCLLLASHALLQAGTIDTVIGTGKPDNKGKNPDIPNEPANPVQGKLILKISDFAITQFCFPIK